MKNLVGFSKGLFLSFFLSFSFFVSYSQAITPTSVTLNTSAPSNCQPISYTIGYTWSCINYQFTGLTYSIAGSVITIDVNFSGGLICQGVTSTSSSTISLTNVPAGTYSVVVRGMLSGVSSGTLNGPSLTVISCCKAVAKFNTNSTNFCDGDTVKLTNVSSSYSSQKWFKNGVQLDTSKNYSEFISGVGTHSYKLVIQSSCGTGGADSIVKTVTVVADPELGNDTSICLGNSIIYSVPNFWKTYNWSDSSTSNAITISTSGKYKVTVTSGATCTKEDSINVNFVGPLLDLATDTVICPSSNISIDVGVRIWTKVLWNTGETTAQISVNKPGIYVANVENSIGCKYSDSTEVLLDKDSVLSFSGVDTICQGDSTEITLSNQFVSYSWFDNDTSRIKQLYKGGTFNVTATSKIGCEVKEAKTITELLAPSLNLGNDTVLCNDSIYLINAARPGFVGYRWQDASRGNRFEIKKAGRYFVMVTDTNGCQGNDTIFITYKECIVEEPKDTTSIISIKPLSNTRYVVFPNPSNDVINIHGIEHAAIEGIRLIGLSGQMLLERKVEGAQNMELDISSLEHGAYILVIEGDNEFYHFPLIKE